MVLAAVADLIPATAIADRGFVGVGSLAGLNAFLATLGLVTAVLGGFRIVRWRWPPLALLIVVNVLICGLFPPRWLLACLQSPDVTFYVERSDGEFALTIDDGLDPESTPLILDVLARHDARATFFVLGETLEENGPLVPRLLAEGHELANHQWSDAPAISLRPDQLQTEIELANEAITRFVAPQWFRPGGGVVPNGAPDYASGLGLRVVLGSVFPFDSHLGWRPFLSAYVEGRTRSGSIVVLHEASDRGRRTAAVLNRVLPRLKERGLRAVTLSELAR